MPGAVGIRMMLAYARGETKKQPLKGYFIRKNSVKNTRDRLIKQGMLYKSDGRFYISGLGKVTLEAYNLIDGYIADRKMKPSKKKAGNNAV